jgi:hypothetical protein
MTAYQVLSITWAVLVYLSGVTFGILCVAAVVGSGGRLVRACGAVPAAATGFAGGAHAAAGAEAHPAAGAGAAAAASAGGSLPRSAGSGELCTAVIS